MDLSIGTSIHGFTVTSVRPVPGTAGELVQLVFEKTGTQAVWHRTGAANKLFNVIFRTLPQDSTGVFHILEHSMLCGSEKYRVKEPFVELLKSSMSTFLNAITFPDKTMYPVSSRNEQDYLNLTEVYLDAVFSPRALEDERIFLQEGWRHELEEEGLSYNGVVFNEMKGAMSSTDELATDGMQQLLFPDTCYGFNYGGDPACIPDLTYEQFCQSYRAFYHPSNALIYLEGDLPLEKTLVLAASYLNRFEKSEPHTVPTQEPRVLRKELPCPATPGEEESGHILLGRIVGGWADKQRNLAVKILCDVLCGSNEAPLKRAILASGLGRDVTLQLDDSIAQSWLSLHVHNANPADAPALRALVRDTISELVRTGLDPEALTASINHTAYTLKDLEEPQDLWRCLNVLNSWLYGGDPMQNLHFEDVFPALRAMAENRGFETLMEELFRDEELSQLCLVPSETYDDQLRNAENARLAREYGAMSAETLRALERRNDQLHSWQQAPDSAEALAALPVLSLDQISPEPERIPTEITEISGVTLLRHRIDSNGIVHLAAYFDLTDLSLEELSDAAFFTHLLGCLPTSKRTAAQIQNTIKTWLGSLSFDLEVHEQPEQPKFCTPRLLVQCSVLEENLPIALELIGDILTGTRLDQPERIREILSQARMEAEQNALFGGHSFAALCAQAHFSACAAAEEAAAGWSYTKNLREFQSDFESILPGFQALAGRILDTAFCLNRLTLSVTASGDADITPLLSLLPRGDKAPAQAAYATALPKNLGIRVSSQASFACVGTHLNQTGTGYDGRLKLVSNILSLSCLWNRIRVQGGAYGAGMNGSRCGSIYCYSYRDPSPARSLEIYRELSDFAREFPDSSEDLTKYIISTIASTEPLLKPNRQGLSADRDYFCGWSHEDSRRERQQLLNAAVSEIPGWCALLEDMAKNAGICVLGSQNALDTCASENLTIVDL